MRQIQRAICGLAALGALCLVSAQASAVTIDTSTNNPNWIASYEGFSGTAFHLTCATVDCISISSSGTSTGTFVGGGSAADFLGSWSATLSFALPTDAQNVTFDYTSIGVDDRAMLFLNGNSIGTFYIFGPQISGSITNVSDFVLGGVNTLTLDVVNNAFDQTGSPQPFLDPFDGTVVLLQAGVSYSLPTNGSVPEPATLALLGVAFAGMCFARWRKLS
jgi:hypothetical protein